MPFNNAAYDVYDSQSQPPSLPLSWARIRFRLAPGLPANLRHEMRRIAGLLEWRGAPSLTRCCGVTSEVMAGLLRRAGFRARTVSCHLTLRTSQGIAHVGRGFARPGQINSHYVVLTDEALIDAALAGVKEIPSLADCPDAAATPRAPGPWHSTSCKLTPKIHAVWEPCADDLVTDRQRQAEKMKAALLLNHWAEKSRATSPLVMSPVVIRR